MAVRIELRWYGFGAACLLREDEFYVTTISAAGSGTGREDGVEPSGGYDSVYQAAFAIGPKVGVRGESLRRWVQAEIATTTPEGQAQANESQRVKDLERQVRDLREANEHMNGQIRRYLPKRTNFATITQPDLDDIIAEINDRPMILGGATPAEVFHHLSSTPHATVALQN